MKSVVERILSAAEGRPEKIACVFSNGAELTYAELAAGISACAGTFTELGRERGFRVLLAAGKTREFLFAYFGAHLAGAVAVPLDPACNAERLSAVAASVDARCRVGAFVHGEAIGGLPEIELGAVSPSRDRPAFATPAPEALADVVFTTGTTGAPKGVRLTHGNLAAAADNINAFVGTDARDVEVVALPVCHSFGLGRVRCLLSVGATVVFVEGFAAVKRLFRALRERRATGFAMVPSAWAYLKKMSGEKLSEFGETLRYIELGSAPMPREDKLLLMKMFPKTRICMHYGLTEASRSAFIEFHEGAENLDSVGKPAPNVRLAVFDERGDRVPAGTPGELCVRGAHVTCGYWRSASPSEDFYAGDFFRTGDLGVENPDGSFRLVGRIKDVVNIGGKKFSPAEVEDALNAFPEIEECACVGVPDPSGVLGEILKACIVAAPGFDADGAFPSADELRRRLSSRLEDFKIPALFVRVPALPKTESGKLRRMMLK